MVRARCLGQYLLDQLIFVFIHRSMNSRYLEGGMGGLLQCCFGRFRDFQLDKDHGYRILECLFCRIFP